MIKKIALLPGHASKDGGSEVCAGRYVGMSEFKLAAAYYLPTLADHLRAFGYDVCITTRDIAGGTTPSYSAKAANATGADLALEFHFNSRGAATGTEVLYYGFSDKSHRFAAVLSEKLAYAMRSRDRGALPAYDADTYEKRKGKERCTNNGWYAFKNSRMPFFMIEPCFAGSNQDDAIRFGELIQSGSFAAQAASVIHASIKEIYA